MESFWRAPDPTREEGQEAEKLNPPDNLSPWLTPRENRYLLRWDTHEIRISKKWYVDDDRSQESVKNVSVDYGKLWQLWNLEHAFRKWVMITAQKPLLKISYGITGEPTDAENLHLASDVRSAVEGWDHLWLKALGQEGQSDEIPHVRTEPFVAALQLVEDHLGPHLEFQIRDWTDHGLKPLRLIPYTENDPSDKPLNVLRDKVFSQLLDELEIHGKIKVSKADTDIANLKQTLLSSVATAAATPEIPGEGPSATPSPEATVVAARTPAPSETSTPNPIQVIGQLQTVATDAVKNNQLDAALAVQKQLQATLDNVQAEPVSEKTTGLAQRLKDANIIIRTAIKENSRKGRIYIHIANESQRQAAKILQGKLENQFAVVGIQNVGGRAYIPDTAEVRFFAFPDPPTTKQSADNIVAILRNNGVSKVRSSYVIPSERDKRESSDINTHFEIWFARDSFAEND